MSIYEEDIQLLMEKIKEINNHSPYDAQKWIEDFLLDKFYVDYNGEIEILKTHVENLKTQIRVRERNLIEYEKEIDSLKQEIMSLSDEADSYCDEIEYYRRILSSLNLESLYYVDGDEEDPDWENLPNDEEPADADEVWNELAGQIREEVDREIVTDLTERINQMSREQQRERELSEIQRRFFRALDNSEEEMRAMREREFNAERMRWS